MVGADRQRWICVWGGGSTSAGARGRGWSASAQRMLRRAGGGA